MLIKTYAVSISLLMLNKFIVIQNPLFNMGFFNYYKSYTLYPLQILTILISVIILWQKRTNYFLSNTQKYVCLSFLSLGFYNSSFFMALIIYLALNSLKDDQRKQIYYILKKAILINVIIGLYQVLTFKSIGLQTIGEINIARRIPGLSTINAYGYEIIRAYGTMAHPNILAAYIALLTKWKYALIPNFSVSSAIAQINYFKPKFSSFIPLILILIIKNPFLNSTSYIERINEYSTLYENQITHNVFIELFDHNLFLLIAYSFLNWIIYKKDKQVGVSLFILAMFDHYLISHPQGVILIPLLLNLNIQSEARIQKK